MLEKAFFGRIWLPNSTAKTTYEERLEDFNAVCNEELHPGREPLRLLDVGISSGITTLEWMDSLERQGVDFRLDAIDICLHAKLVSVASVFHILVDSQARPLQFEMLGCVVSADYGHNAISRLKRSAVILLLRFVYRTLTAPVASALKQAGPGECRKVGPYHIKSVELVTRRLTERTNLRLVEMDASEVDQLDDRYDLIRAANVLNKAYFPSPVLRRIAHKLLGQLAKGGKLAIVRTNSKGLNNGSIYAVDDSGRISKIRQLGTGSELDDLLLDSPTPPLSRSAKDPLFSR